MTETDIKNAILLELSKPKHGCKVFNRPTGLFYPTGKTVTINGRKYLDVENARLVRVNPKGHSDISGHRSDGRAFYIEVKKPDHKTNKKHLAEQENFLEQMRKTGALAGFACSVEDALKIVGLME